MNTQFKIVIKPIKPKFKETDPIKIEAIKQKRKEQREERKNKPVEPKEPKQPKQDLTSEIENINKSLKNMVGLTVDEINDKLKGSTQEQPQPQPKPSKQLSKRPHKIKV